MKQKILLCCICAFLFFSCKKDKKVTPDTKSYPISFNLSGFTETLVPIGKIKNSSLSTQATDTIPVQSLVYMLFAGKPTGQNQVPVSQQRIEKGAAGFGKFTDNIAPGDYTAVFIGGSAALTVYNLSIFGYSPKPHPTTGYWDDTFFTKVPVTVTASGINQSVTMTRRTARLDVILKDAIPAGTTKITVSFRDTSQLAPYTGNSLALMNNQTTKTINASDIGTKNYTITANTVNSKPFDVTISYYGSDPAGPLGTKIVKDVLCKINTKTTLIGNLFSPGNSEFDITVNQDWNAPINVGF